MPSEITTSLTMTRAYCLGLGIGLITLLAPGPSPAQTPADTLRAPRPADIALLSFVKADPASCPFGLRAGQSLEYQLLNAKGKPTHRWRYRVLSISTETSGKKQPLVTTTIKLKSGLYDDKNRLLQQQDLSYLCRHDTAFTDGLGEINYDGLKAFRDRRLAYAPIPIAWPNQPKAGSLLPEGGVEVQVSSPSLALAKVNTTLRQRRVLGPAAPVTVPAGTFQCYAIESQRELATAARADLVIKSSKRQVDYYSPAVGIVKTEYFDKGKLVQTRVLVKH
jgi:hypothetical protein